MPDAILLNPGDVVPDGIAPDTPVYVRVETTPSGAAGVDALLLPDGCLGQHYPATNEFCSEA